MVLLKISSLPFIINATQLILCLSLIILLHELGHFLAARWFGCRVDKFYLFFNPWFSIWKKKKGETEYGIGWIPLGGYVSIAGMVDENFEQESKESTTPPQSWEFRSKPVWQRIIIMLAGIFINFVLGIIIYSLIAFEWGQEKLPMAHLRYGVTASPLAKSVGIHDGDVISSLNGEPIVYFDDFSKQLIYQKNPVITINRNGSDTIVMLPKGFMSKFFHEKNFLLPRYPAIVDSILPSIQYLKGSFKPGDKIISLNGMPIQFFNEVEQAKEKLIPGETASFGVTRGGDTTQVLVKISADKEIGFYINPDKILGSETISFGFFESIHEGINYAVSAISKNFQFLWLLITSPEYKMKDSVGSLISMGGAFGGTWNFKSFWFITAYFSIAIGFFNLLPITGLDGGHALIALFEGITRKKPSTKFLKYSMAAGMLVLLGLFLYGMGLDIYRALR